ncbi:MAG: helix-turn-helix transcriptional regulator [Oscillospiraceae bacterium]|nr:helix-turn-helix transcriptional regulator [Oscillospiraceae bacterium]
MEQTLGKRIVAHRKRLGLTQDQLAEQLGITAQAVSKWENDQSCPDITILPRLAQIFGTTTDALLGIESVPVREAEVVTAKTDDEPDGLHIQTGPLELQFGGGQKSGISLAILILLVGGLLLAGNLLDWPVSFWGLLWPCALLVFGLGGLYPRFGFFRLGCVIFGAYFLADELELLPGILGREVIFPVVLVLFGLSLLADTLRKKRPGRYHRDGIHTSSFQTSEDGFDFEIAFGSDSRVIDLPRLQSGSIDCAFGEMTVDLSGCEEVSAGSHVHVDCSFGSVTLLVPRRYRAEPASDTAFGNVEISGCPDENAAPIRLTCDVSFGTVSVRYI